jgi:myo-inositol 2-dehydrogenase/D-chiro-inositol 1-dehydrogenase
MSLRVGVVGTGVMGAEHARILREETRGAHLAAVADADPARAAAAAFGADVFTDPLALIASDSVDAVVIAAPDATHGALARACLDHAKPVLCEKPLAASTAEALALIEAEVAAGRRLIQVGYMRRFDPAYEEMRRARLDGRIGAPVLLHNVHRNAQAPGWFTGPMALTNSFVHEIDISRWLLGSEMLRADIVAGPGGEPLMITMTTDKDEIVSTEVFVNASYGYHVHAELVGRTGTIAMAAPALTETNLAGAHGHDWPETWVPRFREAYRRQMNAWVQSLDRQQPVGASAWDGYVASAIAEQLAEAFAEGRPAEIRLVLKDDLYR